MSDERPDAFSAFVYQFGAAAAAAGFARWLSGHVRFPGAEVISDVVGFLSRSADVKSRECGFFYGALILVPLAVLGARRVLKSLRGSRGNVAASVALLLGGTIAIGSFLFDLRNGARAATTCVAFPAAALIAGAFLANAIGRRSEAPGRQTGFDSESGIASVGWFAVAVTVVTLAAGPRVDRDLGLTALAVRDSIVFGAAIIAGIGIAIAASARSIAPASFARAAAVLSRAAWLLPIRFAPHHAVWVTAWTAVAGVTMTIAAMRRTDRPIAASIAVPFLVLALVFDTDVNGGIDFFHNGEWLAPGGELLGGAVPYRDLYLQHGLVFNALRSFWTFAWLGPTLGADRLANNALAALTHAAFALLCCQVLRSRLLALAIALLLASPGLELGARLFPLFLALAALVADLRRARTSLGAPVRRTTRWPLLACGAAAGFALFFSLDTGIYATVTALVVLACDAVDRGKSPWRERIAPFATFAFGATVACAPFVAWLAAHGAVVAMIENSRDQLRLQLSVWGLPHPSLNEILQPFRASLQEGLSSGAFLSVLTAATCVAGAAFLAIAARERRFTLRHWRFLVLVVAGACVYRTALGRSDAGHFAYVAAFLWAIWASVAESLLDRVEMRGHRSGPTMAPFLRAGPLVLLFAVWIAGFTPLYAAAQHCRALSIVPQKHAGGGFTSVPLPRLEGVLIPEVQAQALASFASFVAERIPSGQTFFDYSDMGAVYFLLERRSPTRYVQPIYAATLEMQSRLVADLERVRPPFVIVSAVLGDPAPDGIRLEARQPIVKRYIEDHYRAFGEFPFGAVFARRTAE